MIARFLTSHVQRPVTNTPRWRIHHTLKGRVVVTVGNQAQIRERIFDFLAFEEAHPAVNTVRHTRLQQCFFQHTRLGVTAVENGALGKRSAVVLPGFDAVNHKTRFIEFVKSAIEGNRLTVRAIGPQFFTQTPVIVFNQGVSGAQNIAGRAVVLLQTNRGNH